jgi:HAD superfamily hydrolase (TIGR01549 family)
MIRIVVFDFDMTLVDSLSFLREAAIENLLDLGLDFPRISERELLSYTAEKFAKAIESHNHPCPINWREILNGYNASVKKYVDMFEIQDVTTIRRLRDRGIGTAVLSNSTQDVIVKTISKHDLAFDLILASDDATNGRSKVEGLAYCLEYFGCRGHELMYVGDHPNDILCAKQAGVVAVSITTGLHDEKELRAFGSDFVLNAIHEIPGLLAYSQ